MIIIIIFVKDVINSCLIFKYTKQMHFTQLIAVVKECRICKKAFGILDGTRFRRVD